MQRSDMDVDDGVDDVNKGYAAEYGAMQQFNEAMSAQAARGMAAQMDVHQQNEYDPSGMASGMPSGMQQGYAPSPPPMMTAVTCLVCLNGQVNVALDPCQHQFHIQCIERWLHKDKICPVCWIPIQSHHAIMPHYGGQASPMDQSATPRPTSGEAPSSGASMLSANATNILPAQAAANMEHPNPPAVRKGKWTAEESAYCDRLIEEFKKGNLPLAEGTTLRTFLSKLLNCDPMRISKKYTGDQCIGKIIFRQREDKLTKEDAESIRRDLADLEKTYLEREQYNQRRREKRLESEMSRDKNRLMAARQVPGMPGYGGASPGGMGGMRGPPPPLQVSVAGVPEYAQGPPQSMMGNSPAASMGMGGGYMGNQAQMMSASQAQASPSQLRAQMQVQGLQPPPRYPMQPQQSMGPNQGPPNQGYGPPNGPASRGMVKDEYGPGGASGESNGPAMSSSMSASDLNGQGMGRVSSIDSFSCLFPRVSSVDSFGSSTNLASYGAEGSEQGGSGGMIKSISIGDGLSAFFPRTQSLEHLSAMLQENTGLSPKDKSEKGEMKQDEADDAAGGDANAERKLSPTNGMPISRSPDQNQIQAPKPLNKIPRSSSGIFPRVPSMDKLPRVPSMDKLPRIPSMDKLPPMPSMDRLPRPPSMDRLPHVPSLDRLSRVGSSSDMLSRFGSSDQLSSFPSFSNLSNLSSCASYDKLSALGGNGSSYRPTFPRNSSIEDILSLVASSESAGGLNASASNLQLNALAAIAGEESSNISHERKRRMDGNGGAAGDSSAGEAPGMSEVKKSRVST